jgi:hypothetical protein
MMSDKEKFYAASHPCPNCGAETYEFEGVIYCDVCLEALNDGMGRLA